MRQNTSFKGHVYTASRNSKTSQNRSVRYSNPLATGRAAQGAAPAGPSPSTRTSRSSLFSSAQPSQAAQGIPVFVFTVTLAYRTPPRTHGHSPYRASVQKPVRDMQGANPVSEPATQAKREGFAKRKTYQLALQNDLSPSLLSLEFLVSRCPRFRLDL